MDYIYAVLHSPNYREKYAEFLKSDFPKIPYPLSAAHFWQLAEKGQKLRKWHLLEDIPKHNIGLSQGSGKVESVHFAENKVFINARQYFSPVSQKAWDFYIGGYQPAQKYLKDRKNLVLSFDEIENYANMLSVLAETSKMMCLELSE